MSAPLSAGDRLAPRSGQRGGGRPPRPPSPPAHKRRPRRFRWIGAILGALFGLAALSAAGAAAAAFVFWHRISGDLPSVEGLKGYEPAVMSRIYAGNGQLLTEIADKRRVFVPYDAIPPIVVQAFISAEDKDFWHHGGIDPEAIIRAGITDLMRIGDGRRPLGASTITQQVAKNMLLDNRIDFTRKVEEAILAMRMEQVLSKQRILEIYLNEIYLGQGAYGIETAAHAYFNRPLDKLTLAQAAMLGALPKAPNNYNPYLHPEAARARRDWVIDRMAEDRAITPAQAAAAKAEPLVPAATPDQKPIPGANWFTAEVRQELVQRFGEQTVNEGGLSVRTSLDPALQVQAENAVRDGLMRYDRTMGGWRGPITQLDLQGAALARWPAALRKVSAPAGMLPDWRLAVVLAENTGAARVGWLDPSASGNDAAPLARTGIIRLADLSWNHPMDKEGHEGAPFRSIPAMVKPGDVVMVQPDGPGHALLRQVPTVQGALVSLDPATGRVVAMVGGWSFAASQFNRATQAQRQPGSSFKPFVYLAALEKGISPSEKFLDAPISLPDGRGGYWRPNNFEMNFSGPTPLRVALEQSLNLVTVRVAQRIGMKDVAGTAQAFGMADNIPQVLPAALGAVDTTVLREAGAYGSIAEEGRKVVPTLIDSVEDREGHVVWHPQSLSCGCEDPASPPAITDDRQRIADPQSAFQLIHMMEGVMKRGTGIEVGKGIDHTLAGKTGTSQDFNDAWFSGFSPQLVTVVWVGFDNPSTLGNNETGANVAGPIWHQFMAAALKGKPRLDFAQPPGVTMASWQTGTGTVTDAFKPGQVPGASGPLQPDQDQIAGAAAGGMAVPAASAAGVDSSLGGLY